MSHCNHMKFWKLLKFPEFYLIDMRFILNSRIFLSLPRDSNAQSLRMTKPYPSPLGPWLRNSELMVYSPPYTTHPMHSTLIGQAYALSICSHWPCLGPHGIVQKLLSTWNNVINFLPVQSLFSFLSHLPIHSIPPKCDITTKVLPQQRTVYLFIMFPCVLVYCCCSIVPQTC